MCGIAGVIRAHKGDETISEDARVVSGILSMLERRGPDGNKVVRVAPQVLFGATRLAIVDRDNPRAVCPIVSRRHDTALVFNGELYDHHAIRRRLSRDWEFRTTCDSEVTLAILTLEGPASLQAYDGMFSYAFYDGRAGTCALGVDVAGQKPLFYTQSAGAFTFSSSIESLLHQTDSRKQFDYAAISQTLLLRYPITEATHIAEIKRVCGGTTLTVGLNTFATSTEVEPLKLVQTELDARSYAERLGDVAYSAVRSVIPADLSFAMLLSGGLDSSSLCMAVDEPARATAYSIGFTPMSGNEIYAAPFDEFEYSSLVASEKGIAHKTSLLNEESFCRTMLEWCSVADEPQGTADSVALYSVLSQISGTKVVLSGSGIDELFDGYEQGAQLLAKGATASELGRLYAGSFTWLYGVETERLFRAHEPLKAVARSIQSLVDPYRSQTDDIRKLVQLINVKTRGSTYEFRQLDQSSMHHSLEARAPYAVRSFVDAAFECNPEWYHADGTDKWIVKAALGGRVHPAIVKRRKAGFPIPSQLWFSSAYQEMIEERLLGCTSSPLWDVVDRSYVTECWRSGLPEKRNVFYRLLNASEVLSRHKTLL